MYPIARQIYSVSFSNTPATGVDKDIFELITSTNSRVKLREVRLSQSTAAVLGATEVELLSVAIHRGATVAAIGGSTSTPVKRDPRQRVADAVVVVNSSTPGSGSTGLADLLFAGQFLTGEEFLWRPPEDERPLIGLGERLSVRLGASAQTITLQGTMTFEEVGKVPEE